MKRFILILICLLTFSCSVDDDGIKEETYIPQDGIDGFNGIDGENGISTGYYFNNDGCVVFYEYHNSNGIAGWQEGEERHEDSEPLCMVNGQDGYSTYIDIEIIDPGNECEHGGKWITVWIDYNRDLTRQDNEITARIKWCIEKCPHEEVCYDVNETERCGNGRRYVMWIDGKYYLNDRLEFRQHEGDSATIKGRTVKEVDGTYWYVDITLYGGVESDTKDHNCVSDADKSDWKQYTSMTGEIYQSDGSPRFTVQRRGEPFQVGIDANVQERVPGTYGASGWFKTGGHSQCLGDFNFNPCQ